MLALHIYSKVHDKIFVIGLYKIYVKASTQIQCSKPKNKWEMNFRRGQVQAFFSSLAGIGIFSTFPAIDIKIAVQALAPRLSRSCYFSALQYRCSNVLPVRENVVFIFQAQLTRR